MRRFALLVLLTLPACSRNAPTAPPPGSLAEPSACVLPPAARSASEASEAGRSTRRAFATHEPTNVDGNPLATCSTAPMTGVHRDGRCATGPDDDGVHVVCAKMTDEFLRFTAARGNDLSTPARGFPGLRAGDQWCLCAARWAEADAAGLAPPVVLDATERAALGPISRQRLDARRLATTAAR